MDMRNAGRLAKDRIVTARGRLVLLRGFVRRYRWIHTGVGLIGNTCFLVGSVLFAAQMKNASAEFFVAGSSGMLIGNLGRALALHEHERHGIG